MASKLKLTPEHYTQIDAKVKPEGAEVYSVVTHKHRGQYRRSIHVFLRMPNEQELHAYESSASNVEFKNKTAKVRGAQVPAACKLYDTLIARAYEVPVGQRVLGEIEPLNAKDASKFVDPMTKRQAVIELVGQVWASSSFDDDDDEAEGDEGSKSQSAE